MGISARPTGFDWMRVRDGKIAERWTEDELITYLRNPKAYQAQNPRLAYLAERFPIEMPAYPHTDEQALRQLAGWLLSS